MPLDGPLHKAAYKGDYGSVQDHLERYPDEINLPGAQNRTALHRAVGGGLDKKSIVSLLISCKANPNLQDSGGLTPLHWAAAFGYVDYGNILLRAGADINAQTKSGETPLHFCAEKGHIVFAQLLVEKEARLDIRDLSPNGGATPYDAAKKAKQKECMALLGAGQGGQCCTIM